MWRAWKMQPASWVACGRAPRQPGECIAAMPVVTNLYRYPIKGLSAQPVQSVAIRGGEPFPFDRVFALLRPGMPVTADNPKWGKKGLFVMLMLDEGLASVRTHLDQHTLQLSVFDGQRQVLAADLGDAAGRAAAASFFHRLAPSLRAAPAMVQASGGHFMDKPDSVISLLNLATVRSLEQQWGYRIDPLRFRANIVIDGAAPWEEFEWIGGAIRLGEASFTVDRRNGRCGATNVDPASGRRDLDIPGSLRRAFGHKDLGVYLVARNNATLQVGDRLEKPGETLPQGPAVDAPPPSRRAFMCSGCYYVFDEAPDGEAGIRFTDLPEAWRCPDCGTDKSAFKPHAPQSRGLA